MSEASLVASSVSRSRANLALILGCVFFGYAFIQRVAPSVITDELMRDFSVGGAALGSLSAWYFYSYASIQLPVGMLMDRFGPRKLMSFTIGLCAVATLGFSYSESVLSASLYRGLIGATVAFGFVGTLTILGYWFAPNRFATLAGVLQAVGMCGAMLGQAPLRFSVEQVGWRSTMMGLAVIAIVLSLLLFFIIPKRSTNTKVAGSERGTKTTGYGVLSGLKKVCVNPQSWYCSLIGFGLTATMLAFAGLWSVPWLSSQMGFSKTEAAAIASLFFLGWGVGSPLAGWLSDFIGKRKPVLYIGCILNILFFSIIIYGNLAETFFLGTLFFLCGASGSVMIVCFSMAKELNSPTHSATAIGLLNMFVVGSGAVMQPLIGWLLDGQWSGEMINGARLYGASAFTTAFTALLFCNVLALFCIIKLNETYCQQRKLS